MLPPSGSFFIIALLLSVGNNAKFLSSPLNLSGNKVRVVGLGLPIKLLKLCISSTTTPVTPRPANDIGLIPNCSYFRSIL